MTPMAVLISSLAFLLLLSVLILIHEWGHFAAARFFGVTVEEFGFGLPPRVLSLFRWRGTLFSLNGVPFGGFVRLKGENTLDRESNRASGSFGGASIPARLVILSSGVLMNFLLAIALLTLGFSLWRWVPVSVYTSLEHLQTAADRGIIDMELGVRIADIVSGGGAAQAGMPAGVFVTGIDDVPIRTPADVVAAQSGKRQVTYTVMDPVDGEERTYAVPLSDGQAGVAMTAFPLRIAGRAQPVHRAFVLALEDSWMMMVQTVYAIGHLFVSLAQRGIVPEGISGIVGIAQYTHISVQEGFGAYLRLVALLSLSLAALNILPLPALDGGRIVFVLAELIQRRPVNRTFEVATNSIGFIFLVLLLLLITYHDILRLF